MSSAIKKIDAEIERLETLARIQKQNAEFYFWERNDDTLGHSWQDAMRKTNKDVEQLKKERAVILKWVE